MPSPVKLHEIVDRVVRQLIDIDVPERVDRHAQLREVLRAMGAVGKVSLEPVSVALAQLAVEVRSHEHDRITTHQPRDADDARTASSFSTHLDAQQRSQLRPPSMEQNPLIALCDSEKRDDIETIEAFNVAEHNDLPLLVGESRQQVVNPFCDVLGGEPVIDLIGPWDWRLRPSAAGIESFDSLTISAAGTLLAARGGASTVEQHAKQPGLERRPALEAIHPSKNGEPRVLARFFGNRATAYGCLGETEQPRLITADELDERGLVAGAQPLDKLEIILHAG